MDIYILRHGEAGDRVPTGESDAERSLTSEGRKEVADICKRLHGVGLKFDKIASSPLKRAKETAEIAAKTFGDKFEEWVELKPEANREELAKRLSRLKRESSVLLIGHEPFLSSFIADAIAAGPQTRILLKKSGLARLSVTAFSPRMTGELRWLLSPKVIKRLR